MEKENFITLLENSKKLQINNKYNNYFKSLPDNISLIPNLLLYGPPGSGKYSESLKLLNNMPFIDKFTIKKTSEFYKFLS